MRGEPPALLQADWLVPAEARDAIEALLAGKAVAVANPSLRELISAN